LLVPFAALVAGSASEIITLLFGPAFAAAAPVLPWLIGGAVALVFVSVTIAMLTAAGMPWMTIVVATPVPVLALPAYVAVIPRAGPTGVAMVTSLCAFLGAVAGGLAVSRVCRITAPRGTVIRTVFVSVCAYAAAVLWTASGWLILFKLPVIGLAILVALGALGEFSGDEIATMLRSLRRRRTVPA
jgi:O-antigen/teichoic acid export membrane protein